MNTAIKKHDWGLFAAGLALIIIGFVFLLAPGLTLVSIAAIAGAMLLVVGAFDLYAYIRYRKEEGLTGWALAYAICDIILGLMFLIHPVVSAAVIPWVAGVFVAAYGIFEIVAAVQMGRSGLSWGWMLFSGIVSLLCSWAFFVMPETFAIFLAFFLIMRGTMMAVYGFNATTMTATAMHTR